jgi:hypothetical protein
MRFTLSTAAFLAFASSVLAQTANFDVVTSPKKDEVVAAGATYTIVWEPDTKHPGTVSLSLLGGETPSTLDTLATLKTGVASSAGKFEWAVDSTLGKDKTYGIQITLESDKKVFQYSFPFQIKAGSGGSGTTKSGYSTSSGSATYSTSSYAGSSSTYSTKVYPTTSVYPYGNSTTATAGPSVVTLTSTTAAGGTPTKSTTSSVPTSGAQNLAAGSVALLGAVAAAVFAL